MRRALPVLVTLGLIVPAPAAARSYWDRAYPKAVAYWQRGEPCGGNVTMRWAALPSDIAALAAWNGDRTNCSVTYRTRSHWRWAFFCVSTLHEVGHLLGYHHTTAFSVMNPDAANRSWPRACR